MIRDDAISLADSIFISYRRADSGESAGRIYDWLAREFPRGTVFKDVDSIPPGVDFREHLKVALGRCRIVLVLIGTRWATVCDEQGNKRLENPADLVRVEAETALGRENLRVIPVLVGGANLPSAAELPTCLHTLLFLNTAQLRPDPDFANDMARLIRHVKQALLPDPLPETSSSIEVNTPEPLDPSSTAGLPLVRQPEVMTQEIVKLPANSLRGESSPPTLPHISLRFHRHCIAGMRGVFQLRAINTDWRPLYGAKLRIVSSSWKERELEIDLFPLLPTEEALDTFVAVYSDAGPGTIQSCTLKYPGPWGMLTAQGRWPGEFPVLSYQAAIQAASSSFGGGSTSERDWLNDYLLTDLPAAFVDVRFSAPQLTVEVLPEVFKDSLLGVEFKKVEVSRGQAVWFSQYPVRQKDWKRLMGGSMAQQRARANREVEDGEQANCPMHYVDMAEAKAFCQMLNEESEATGLARPGYQYRLPTETEWRLACGQESRSDEELNIEAWHGGKALNSCQPVGRLRANRFGLYDMRGNVFEWCLPDSRDPGAGMIAGGSWFNHSADRQACRSGLPGPCPIQTRSSRIGFRVVLARHGS